MSYTGELDICNTSVFPSHMVVIVYSQIQSPTHIQSPGLAVYTRPLSDPLPSGCVSVEPRSMFGRRRVHPQGNRLKENSHFKCCSGDAKLSVFAQAQPSKEMVYGLL